MYAVEDVNIFICVEYSNIGIYALMIKYPSLLDCDIQRVHFSLVAPGSLKCYGYLVSYSNGKIFSDVLVRIV
jgi:hypothetical protein